jgi:hypothetical protein
MVGNTGELPAGPVVDPSLRAGKQRRLFRDTREEMARRKGPVRQVLNRDQVVSPIALEQKCLELLQRTQHAITTIVTSRVYLADLRETLGGHVLRQHEWQIALELREITELMLELAGYTEASTGMPPKPASWRLNRWRDRWPPPTLRIATGRQPSSWRPTTTSTSTSWPALPRTG